MFEFRVTKYDPTCRDICGAYTRDEWTSVRDIGRSFAGVSLTKSEYQRVEDAYVTTAIAIMQEAGIESLMVTGLENHFATLLPFVERSVLKLPDAGMVIRQVLREEFWCRLEAEIGFVHIGYDYYMYVGSNKRCLNAESLAKRLGLFIEPFQSPYTKQS